MDLVNVTRMAAGYTVGTEPSGREHLVVVVKGTFDIPSEEYGNASLSREQVPVVDADILGGTSSALPIAEADLCLHKPKCDVLVTGSAHAPRGRPASRVQVGVRVGGWSKLFDVVGDRRWTLAGPLARPSNPEPFTVMPITYERAFGGVDRDTNHPSAKEYTYLANPVGCGYRRDLSRPVTGTPVPNTEQSGSPIERPDRHYAPMALGPIGRNWEPRYRLAGTYDDEWLANVFPFLPADFDDRYHQSAPVDQQIPYPSGGEEVVLLNLCPEGRLAFRLPRAQATVTVSPRHGDHEPMGCVIDTVSIEPDLRRFTVCWRGARPLARSLFEIDEVVVGQVGLRFLADRDGLPPRYKAWTVGQTDGSVANTSRETHE